MLRVHSWTILSERTATKAIPRPHSSKNLQSALGINYMFALPVSGHWKGFFQDTKKPRFIRPKAHWATAQSICYASLGKHYFQTVSSQKDLCAFYWSYLSKSIIQAWFSATWAIFYLKSISDLCFTKFIWSCLKNLISRLIRIRY